MPIGVAGVASFSSYVGRLVVIDGSHKQGQQQARDPRCDWLVGSQQQGVRQSSPEGTALARGPGGIWPCSCHQLLLLLLASCHMQWRQPRGSSIPSASPRVSGALNHELYSWCVAGTKKHHTSQEVSCWRPVQFLAPHVRGVDSCGQQWWVTHWVA